MAYTCPGAVVLNNSLHIQVKLKKMKKTFIPLVSLNYPRKLPSCNKNNTGQDTVRKPCVSTASLVSTTALGSTTSLELECEAAAS